MSAVFSVCETMTYGTILLETLHSSPKNQLEVTSIYNSFSPVPLSFKDPKEMHLRQYRSYRAF